MHYAVLVTCLIITSFHDIRSACFYSGRPHYEEELIAVNCRRTGAYYHTYTVEAVLRTLSFKWTARPPSQNPRFFSPTNSVFFYVPVSDQLQERVTFLAYERFHCVIIHSKYLAVSDWVQSLPACTIGSMVDLIGNEVA